MDHHADIDDILDDQQRRDETRIALTVIGTDVLREPAKSEDIRVLPVWLAALAVVGLDLTIGGRQVWSRTDVRENLDVMAPSVQERATHALALIDLFDSRRPGVNRVAVCDFMAAVALPSPPAVAAVSASLSSPPEPTPLPTVAVESQEARQARRYQACIAAGLSMPTDTYAHMPRGIGTLAKREGITRQAFAEDVKAHIGRLHGR
jgi:hypothetical protein